MTSVSCAIDIDQPVLAAYDAWSGSPRIPTFMGGTSAARPADPVSVDWVTMIEGRAQDFQAEVSERVEGETIAWTGRGRPHAGVVSFVPLGGDRCRITVDLDWEPVAGAALADLLVLRRQLQHELECFSDDLATGSPGERL